MLEITWEKSAPRKSGQNALAHAEAAAPERMIRGTHLAVLKPNRITHVAARNANLAGLLVPTTWHVTASVAMVAATFLPRAAFRRCVSREDCCTSRSIAAGDSLSPPEPFGYSSQTDA